MSAPELKPVLTSRDQRLDMFRGLALVMIFINHVPGTVYENWTNRNFGFSDAAEAFVLMSGMASGLAYSQRFVTGPYLVALLKVWARVRQLYFVHVTTTMMALAVFATAALYFDLTELLVKNNIRPIFLKPLGAMIGIPALTHQLGYFNILPLYAVLLLATPFVMPLALRRPLWLLAGSIILWALAGQFRLNFPNFPNPGGWFFNPFSWQLIFIVGLLSGIAMKQRRQFVPYKHWLFALCAAFLILVLVWVKWETFGAHARDVLGMLSKAGLPFHFTGFDKTFVALPRLLHVLALAYVLASLPPVRWLADSRYTMPLTLMGRFGLPVFATGSVLSMVGQALKARIGADPVADFAIITAGLALQVLLAFALFKITQFKAGATAPLSTHRSAPAPANSP